MPAAPSKLIAIVDNDPSVRKALLRLMQASGMAVQAFSSGEDFLATLDEQSYQCVILDLHMMGLTGTAIQSKCMMKNSRMKIIIITAHDEPGIREKCLADGATAYFTKPIDASELLIAIENAVN